MAPPLHVMARPDRATRSGQIDQGNLLAQSGIDMHTLDFFVPDRVARSGRAMTGGESQSFRRLVLHYDHVRNTRRKDFPRCPLAPDPPTGHITPDSAAREPVPRS